MKCPRDATPLEPVPYHGVTVDQCSQCKGMWFDADALRKAIDNTDEALRWLDFEIFSGAEKLDASHGERACPQCSEPMRSSEYMESKVRIDACPKGHGIWLDSGEFDKIVGYLEKLVLTMDTHDYERAARSEFKEIFTGPESRISEIRDFFAVFRLLEMRAGVEHPRAAEIINRASSAGL